MLELSYREDWCIKCFLFGSISWQSACKHLLGLQHEILLLLTPSLLLWNCFFSHAYFVLLGQKLLGYNMTGLEPLGEAEVLLTFTFFLFATGV